MKEFYFDLEASRPALSRASSYLDNFPFIEEGGLLLGKRVWDVSRTKLTVTVNAFVPLKRNPESWNISETDMRTFNLPPEEVGYFPNPSELFALRNRILPLNSKSSLMEVGFVHNHMQHPANPSRWDRMHTNPEFGYVLPIYSNKEKHLKIWFVSNGTENETWLNTYDSLAPVELAHIL